MTHPWDRKQDQLDSWYLDGLSPEEEADADEEGGAMICPHCGGHIAWKNIDDKTRKAVLKLNKQGCSLRDIAQMLNVSFSSVGRIIRKAKNGGEGP